MTETVIIFICGMFAGALMEFIIATVVIMKGEKRTDRIYYIISWYKHEKEGQLHCDNEYNPILFDNREVAISYMEELIIRNPDYEFSLRSIKIRRGDKKWE